MLLKNVHTGDVCTERDLVINWEMDIVYDCLNEETDEQQPETFAEWLRERLEMGDYELIEQPDG